MLKYCYLKWQFCNVCCCRYRFPVDRKLIRKAIRKRMKLKQHITISLFFSAFLFAISKSWIISTSSFVSGFLIDIDHVLDYFWGFRKRFRVKEFFDDHYNGEILFIMVIFHSWELLVLLSICVLTISWNPWIIGITIGLTQHVVLDQIFNKPNKWWFFFFWRLNNGFDAKSMSSN